MLLTSQALAAALRLARASAKGRPPRVPQPSLACSALQIFRPGPRELQNPSPSRSTWHDVDGCSRFQLRKSETETAGCNELVSVLHALASLALDVRNDGALEILITSPASFARVSVAGRSALRSRAAASRVSTAQVAISVVRRAVHAGLSNCLVNNAGAKRECYSPERLAVGASPHDMAALCRLVESLDRIIDAMLELALPAAAASAGPLLASRLAEVLLACGLSAAGNDAMIVLGSDDLLRARAVVRTAAEAVAVDSSASGGAWHGSRPMQGADVLRAVRDLLPAPDPRSRAAAEEAAQPQTPPPPPGREETAAVALLPPPPGFMPLSPELPRRGSPLAAIRVAAGAGLGAAAHKRARDGRSEGDESARSGGNGKRGATAQSRAPLRESASARLNAVPAGARRAGGQNAQQGAAAPPTLAISNTILAYFKTEGAVLP
jgi:hypothetical protein